MDASVVAKKIQEDAKSQLASKSPAVSPTISREDTPKEKALDSTTEFFIKKIVVTGAKTVPEAEIKKITAPFENQKLTLKKTADVAKLFEQEYRNRGYLTTIAYLPPQRIIDEKIEIRIVEGRMGDLLVEGNRYFSSENIKRYWRIKYQDLMTGEEMLASLRRLNENPDREVKLVLRPGKSQGLTDAYLKVKDRLPIHFIASLDNQGSRNSGRYRPTFMLRHNDFLIPDSSFLFGTIFSNDFGALFTQYDVPLNTSGTKLSLASTLSQVAPKKDIKHLDVNGLSQNYNLSVKHPWIERENLSVTIAPGIEFKNTRTQALGGVFRKEKLRIPYLEASLKSQDRLGTFLLDGRLSWGVEALGASRANNPLASRPGASPSFLKYDGSLTRTWAIGEGRQVVARSSFQLASDKLPSMEQFYLGGMNSVRGYPESDHLADQGLSVNLEYLTRVPFIDKSLRFPFNRNWTIYDHMHLVAFFDNALGYTRGVVEEPSYRHLMSLGGGIRVSFSENFSLRCEIGHILGDEPLTESDHTRAHFRLEANF